MPTVPGKQPAKVTVTLLEESEILSYDAYNGRYLYKDGKVPRSFTGTGGSLDEACASIKSTVEAGLSKNTDKAIHKTLSRLDKHL